MKEWKKVLATKYKSECIESNCVCVRFDGWWTAVNGTTNHYWGKLKDAEESGRERKNEHSGSRKEIALWCSSTFVSSRRIWVAKSGEIERVDRLMNMNDRTWRTRRTNENKKDWINTRQRMKKKKKKSKTWIGRWLWWLVNKIPHHFGFTFRQWPPFVTQATQNKWSCDWPNLIVDQTKSETQTKRKSDRKWHN